MSVKNELIKLAWENRELRRDLLPVIHKISNTPLLDPAKPPSHETLGEIKKEINKSNEPEAVKEVAQALAGEFEKNPAFREQIIELAINLKGKGKGKGMTHLGGIHNMVQSLKDRAKREQDARDSRERAGLGADFSLTLAIALTSAANALLAEHGNVPPGMSEFLRDVSLSLSVVSLIAATKTDYEENKNK